MLEGATAAIDSLVVALVVWVQLMAGTVQAVVETELAELAVVMVAALVAMVA